MSNGRFFKGGPFLLFTPLIGVPMENSLDIAVVWALYGIYMCHNFWPMPSSGNMVNRGDTEPAPVKWPKRAHPGVLTQAGQERTPWLTSWARATFEQGCLSVLPHLEGPCKAMSLPGKHLFQASRIVPDRMRPIIFHAFGKAKLDAPLQLDRLARQGWETVPIALLGMPHCPAAWSFESWKPIGGCCFTGGPVALAGNSALRFCLLMQWRATAIPPSALFPGACVEDDTDVESARTLSEPDQEFLERTLLTAATDQNSRESGSSLPERLPAKKQPCQRSNNPQTATPALYVPWQEVAQHMGIPVVHEELTADLRTMFQQAIGILSTEEFHRLQGAAFSRTPDQTAPVETIESFWTPCMRYILGFLIGKSCYGTWPNPTSSS